MRLRLIRNATLRIDYAGRRLLLDPMLDPAGARGPVANTPNDRRLVEAINHCLETRADLLARLREAGLEERVSVPADGAEAPSTPGTAR